MLVSDLIRFGEPLVDKGGFSAKEILSLVGDLENAKVKNHFRHVIVVELPNQGRKKPKCHPIQEIGDEITVQLKGKKTKQGFFPDAERAVGIPFTVPSGGNPLNPQGRYGIPAYPCWTKHLDSFAEAAANVVAFLSAKKNKKQLHRLDRTPDFSLTDAELESIGEAVHQECRGFKFSGKTGKHLGLLLLVRCDGKNSTFQYSDDANARNRVGKSKLENGKSIVPNYDACLNAMWDAKEQEGAELGKKENGTCSYSGLEGMVISTYSKAWPWAGITWDCPIPNGGDEKHLIEGIALSPEAYRAFTLGARLFYRLSKRVGWEVLPEVFSPSDSLPGKELTQSRSAQNLPAISGTALLLPLVEPDAQSKAQKLFVRGARGMLQASSEINEWAEGQLRTVAGFDAFLPPSFSQKNEYRLSLVYFQTGGQESDIHIRCTIEDVVPSTIGHLRKLASEVGDRAMSLFSEINPTMPEKRKAYLASCFCSVPYLLSRAYGGAFLWQQLERVFHRQPLDISRPMQNVAQRINSVVTKFPDSRFDIADEVAFMLIFLDFANRFNSQIAKPSTDEELTMRPWKELIDAFGKGALTEIDPESMAELGFLAGMIVRKFSGWFRTSLGGNADYLRDRVLTFGATISPREVGKAVRGIRELAFKYPVLKKNVELGQLVYYENKEEREKLIGDFAKRHGILLAMLAERETEIEKNRDEFMNGFWSGYSLLNYDYKPKPKTKSDSQNSKTKPEQEPVR